jgi:superkiller protein 3
VRFVKASFNRIVFVLVASVLAATIASVQAQHSTTNKENSELQRAAELLQSGKLDEAESILRHVIRANPKNADAHNLLGAVMDQRGKPVEAEREYRTALRFNPNSISAMANLGVLLAHTQREAEAEKVFASVLRLSPQHAQATINLGLLYASRKDYERAAELLTKANELQPRTFDILFQLGVALYNLKRLNDAAAAFESASTVSSDAAWPFYYLGLIAAARGQDEAAGELWEKAVALRPNQTSAIVYASLFRRRGFISNGQLEIASGTGTALVNVRGDEDKLSLKRKEFNGILVRQF